MPASEILTGIHVALAAAIMVLSAIATRRLLGLLRGAESAEGWRTLFVLMIFFYAGFLAILGSIVAGFTDFLETLTGLIVFMGALTVYVAIRQGHRTIEELSETSVSRDYFDNIIQSMINTVIAVTPDLRIETVNQATCELLGYTKEELIGLPIGNVCSIEELFDVTAVAGPSKNDSLTDVERTYLAKDGAEIPVLFSGSVIRDPIDGQIQAIVCVAADITERKRMEVELAEYTRNLETAYQDLQKLDEMKDSFLSTVSHELRTPLTSIKGFAEILLSYDEVDKETQTEFLTIINNESDRLTRLINDVLDLAKIESGRMQWQTSEQALPELIETATNATRALSVQKNLTVHTDLSSDLPPVWADKDRLVQVVTNLLSNAIKFTPEGGEIRIQAHLLDGEGAEGVADMMRVSVSDTGTGISPEDQLHVFEKFRQVGDTLTERPEGTGLGLPICREILDYHEGQIWVESELGKGSTFFFTLPIKGGVQAKKPSASEQIEEVSVAHGGTILVVDDEENVRRLLEHELTRRGYRVIKAADGKEAIEVAREHKPDLITLDIQIPHIDGFDVTSVLKNDPETIDIPILILSIVEDRDRGYRLGANDYLTKPFTVEAVLEKMTRLLQQDKKKVLVVDDDKALVRAITFELERRGFSPEVAYDGEEALKAFGENRPDLIVLDITMPKMDGYEVIKELKTRPDEADIPIVVLTGVEIDGGRVSSLSMGAAEYVTKSGGLGKLYEQISAILGTKSPD